MEMDRCNHFSLEAEEIFVSGAPVVLRVPIRRCALAERMIGYIAQTPRGKQVAHKLRIAYPHPDAYPGPQITGGAAMEGGKPPSAATDEQIRAAFGPDLEAIHHTECTRQRCKESCTPSFKVLLEHFDLHALADQETGTGCLGASD